MHKVLGIEVRDRKLKGNGVSYCTNVPKGQQIITTHTHAVGTICFSGVFFSDVPFGFVHKSEVMTLDRSVEHPDPFC